MPGLGNDLVVNLAGNNSKLKSKIAESKGGLQSFASSAAGFLNPVTAGLTAITGAAIGAGVAVYGLTTRIAGLAQVADQATQTGLSGAFIQRLGYAADQSGVSVETLIGGIKKLTIAIGKGDDNPFAALGVSLADLKKLNPEQQFMRIAAEISKLPTAAERAAAAVKIFGKTGIDMTGLFAGGMSDLNALMADAQSLGIGISAEELAKAAAADDAIQRMKASFGALLDQITVGVAPVFKSIADYIAEWIPPVTKFFDKFNGLEGKAQFVGDVFDASMSVAFEGIRENWARLMDDMLDMAIQRGKEIAMGLSGIDFVKSAFGAGQAAGGKANEIAGRQGGLQGAQARLADVLGRLGPDDQGLIRGKLPAMGGKPNAEPADGSALATLSGDIARGVGGLFDQALLAGQSALTDVKIKGGFLGSIVSNMFTGDKTDKEKTVGKASAQNNDPRFAGAMQQGSAEAYSTIVQAMFRGKDPNVQATEKQTGVLVKAMKDNKPKFNMVGAFS